MVIGGLTNGSIQFILKKERERPISRSYHKVIFLRLIVFTEIFSQSQKISLQLYLKNNPLAGCDKFPISAFDGEIFMLLEKGDKYEISELFERNGVKPDVRFITWDDYAVMSMVENGLGISILPELILKRIPYKIVIKHLDVPAFRNIGLAFRSRKSLSLAAERFIGYCGDFAAELEK